MYVFLPLRLQFVPVSGASRIQDIARERKLKTFQVGWKKKSDQGLGRLANRIELYDLVL